MDRGQLAKALNSLTLEDGKHDVLARGRELDNLVSTLSNHEIRRIRKNLNNMTMQMDICSHLPVEILLIVANHLELEDIFRLRSVSRSWHVNFTNSDLCLGMVQKHFPSAWGRFADGTNFDIEGHTEKRCLLDWFQTAAVAHLKRLHGRYHSTSTYYYSSTTADELTKEEQRERQYCAGKVAFRTRPSEILIRDLRTGQISRCIEENRKPIQKPVQIRYSGFFQTGPTKMADFPQWLLFDRYLVISTINPNTVCAVSLADNDQIESIRLPNRLSQLSGHADQVGIVTATAEFLWTIGGSLKSIDIPGHRTRPTGSQTNILFPGDNLKMFVTCQDDIPVVNDEVGKVLRVSVNEYSLDGSHKAIYTAKLFPQNLWSAYMSENRTTPVVTGRTIVWQLKPDLPYTMDLKQGSCLTKHSTCQHAKEVPSRKAILLLAFDLYTKDFTFKTYHFPSEALRTDQAFFWDEQAILPVFVTSKPTEASSVGTEDIILVALNNCDQLGKQLKPVPWYGKESVQGKDIVFSPQEDWKSIADVAWCWVKESNYSRSIHQILSGDGWVAPEDEVIQICGDEDFVVVFERDNRMVVWCFDQSVDLPTSWTRLDPALSDDSKDRSSAEGLQFHGD